MRKILTLSSLLLIASGLTGCDALKGPSTAEQVERTIRQEVKANQRGLTALIAKADATPYDGFAWRRGELLQIRQNSAEGMILLENTSVPEIISTAVEFNVPSFSIVRYQQGWLVVFRNYLSAHCQSVYAYAYNGSLPDVPQCTETLYAENANGQCQTPINAQWAVFKEWFFAENLADQGNPVCQKKAAAGWLAQPN